MTSPLGKIGKTLKVAILIALVMLLPFYAFAEKHEGKEPGETTTELSFLEEMKKNLGLTGGSEEKKESTETGTKKEEKEKAKPFYEIEGYTFQIEVGPELGTHPFPSILAHLTLYDKHSVSIKIPVNPWGDLVPGITYNLKDLAEVKVPFFGKSNMDIRLGGDRPPDGSFAPKAVARFNPQGKEYSLSVSYASDKKLTIVAGVNFN